MDCLQSDILPLAELQFKASLGWMAKEVSILL